MWTRRTGSGPPAGQGVPCGWLIRGMGLTGAAFMLLLGLLHGLGPMGPTTQPAPRFTVSRETTFVVGPVQQDGAIDYPSALSSQWGRGVTMENNACVLLLEAMGPAPLGSDFTPDYFAALGVAPLSDDSSRLAWLEKFAQGERWDADQRERLHQVRATAMRRPWTREEFPQLAQWLDHNETPYQLVRRAVERERYASPWYAGVTSQLGDHAIPELEANRELARLLCVRALLRAGERSHEEAWQDVWACLSLGRLVGSGPSMVEYKLGAAIESLAIGTALTLLKHTQVSATEARVLLGRLGSFPPPPNLAAAIDWGERCIYLDAILQLASGRIDAHDVLEVAPNELESELASEGASIDWDVPLRKGNMWFDRLVQAFEARSHASRVQGYWRIKKALRAESQRQSTAWRWGQRSERLHYMLGDKLVASYTQSYPWDLDEIGWARQSFDFLAIALALEAYHDERGCYPELLHELAPTWVERIPLDVFSDSLLKYRRERQGYLLYSVGPNARDDKGRERDYREGSDDPSVRMP